VDVAAGAGQAHWRFFLRGGRECRSRTIAEGVEKLETACRCLRASSNLKIVLKLALDLGNLTNVSYALPTHRATAARGISTERYPA
jgi:hypothetical protein